MVGGGERLAIYTDRAIQRAAAEIGAEVETAILCLSGATAAGSPRDRVQAVPGRIWDAQSLGADDIRARLAYADRVYVHQCMTEVGLFVASHARLKGIPVFGSDAGAGEAGILTANPDAMLVYDAVHAISEFAASAFQAFPVPVHVVPGPVDTDLHQPPTDAGRRNARIVVMIGRVLPHKGVDRVIRVLPPDLSLVVVGQHYDRNYFGYLCELACGKDVRFLDDLDDGAVRELLHEAALFVHASTHVDHRGRFYHKPELLGLAPLEALANGVPTLVSDAGSLPELGALPGCRVFETDGELAALLQETAAGRLEFPQADDMHAAVAAKYGSVPVGLRLLEIMGVVTGCGSS